jgi:hypothetical protein
MKHFATNMLLLLLMRHPQLLLAMAAGLCSS